MRAREQLKLEARRSALHRLSGDVGAILDRLATFERRGNSGDATALDDAKLEPSALAAAATLAISARSLAAAIKRTIASLNEDS